MADRPVFPPNLSDREAPQGLMLRDFFAATFIHAKYTRGVTDSMEDIARLSYEFADLMVKKREK